MKSIQTQKDQSSGKIISQRKPETPLIKQYDTKLCLNMQRINQLKQKYNKNQTRTPLLSLNSNEIVPVSDFTEQVRQKQKLVIMEKEKEKNRQDQLRRHRNQDVCKFKKKAELTNYNINQKLNYIQQQLNKLKYQQQRKVITNLELQVLKNREKQEQIQRQIQIGKQIQKEKEKEKERERSKQNLIKYPESIKVSIVQEVFDQDNISDHFSMRLLQKKFQTDEKNIKLLGEFKAERNISQQFILFINRLKDQISLDFDFTQLLLSLSVKDRQAVREYVKKNYPSADLQYFVISPIEHDPLQKDTKAAYKGTIQSIAKKLYEFYTKIEQHFKLKLFRTFQISTIDTLFEQIGEKQITLGHLISYINMRTGREFRNRALVKLLKRLGICNQIIDQKLFTRGFVKY